MLDPKLIRRVNLKKDDVIVINIKQSIPKNGIQSIMDQIKKAFLNNKVLVLTEGATLSTIREKRIKGD